MEFPLVTIPNTEVRSLVSAILDQEFRIFVALPSNYRTSADSYPVLFVSDADGIFGLVTETIRFLQLRHELPEMVIVGIGYPVNDFHEVYGLRTRDLTPTEKVFISAGTLEESMQVPVRGGPARFVTNIQAITEKLQSRGYENLTLTHHVFEDESHVSGPPGAFSRGLRVVFKV